MNSKDSVYKHTNALINETSPYLLQHAHNPVNWYPWGEESLEKAKKENKLLLISIGYSACHWCHVMEHECFEDEEVAALMNEHFVCIKVDREERPDIDQIYMDAVQLLSQRGGWPLNCFALPDGRPFYGGTYFPKKQWMQLLEKVQQEYSTNKEKVEEFAERLTQGIRSNEIIEINPEPSPFQFSLLDSTVQKWSAYFDNKEGGPKRAPKFPLPNNYQFLLQFAYCAQNKEVENHALLTLDKMAYGGIYDHLGGGFARYSVDDLWKVPHFEKMLYDNAQLISLYTEAFQFSKSPLYKQVVYETIDFVLRELTDKTGAFYSALDADSEGEEGKFYVWKKEELQSILGEGFSLFAEYYNINSEGFWEHGNYILLRKKAEKEIAAKFKISEKELAGKLQKSKEKLLAERNKRISPGLDDKSLTSWNALMLNALADAYLVFGEEKFLAAAVKNASFILKKQKKQDGGLWHSYKAERSTINGYLEDYCFTVEALIKLYQASFNEIYLQEAKKLADYSIAHFYDKNSGMFYFTSDIDSPLIARKMEINDNVIPASNSSMAKGLFLLGHYFDDKNYIQKSEQMLQNVKSQIAGYGSGYSNWAQLLIWHTKPFYEIAVCGEDAKTHVRELSQDYIPGKLFIVSEKESELPLLENKYVKDETLIYVCIDKACKLPVNSTKEALKQITY